MKYIVDYIDAPTVLNAVTTPIPGSGSSTMQIVASLATPCNEILVKDGISSAFIGLYSGQSGQETLRAIICGPGDTRVQVTFIKGDRISIRNMDTPALSTGSLVLLFLYDDKL